MFHFIYRNIRFLFKDISKSIFKALFSSFGIIFLIAFLVIYISFRQSVSNYISDNVFGTMEINDIIIHPQTYGGRDVMVSSENSIRRNVVTQIRGMQELSNVYSLIRMNYVARMEVSAIGMPTQVLRMPVYGIEQGFFRNKNPKWQSFKNNIPLPFVMPKLGLQFINNYLSQEGFPQFTETTLAGYPAMLKISSYDAENVRHVSSIPLELHSFSGAVDFAGIVVPTVFIADFAQKHKMEAGKTPDGYTYVRMYAKVNDIKKLPEVTDKLKKMGLRVESQSDISKKTNKAMAMIDGMFLLIGIVMLLLTVISIFNSYLVIAYNSGYEISLKRVIGLSKLRVIFLFVFQAAVIGVVLGIIGYFLGHYLLKLLTSQIAFWIPAFKDLNIIEAEGSYLHYALILSVAVSALSALFPAIFASNKNLFKTMTQ